MSSFRTLIQFWPDWTRVLHKSIVVSHTHTHARMHIYSCLCGVFLSLSLYRVTALYSSNTNLNLWSQTLIFNVKKTLMMISQTVFVILGKYLSNKIAKQIHTVLWKETETSPWLIYIIKEHLYWFIHAITSGVISFSYDGNKYI